MLQHDFVFYKHRKDNFSLFISGKKVFFFGFSRTNYNKTRYTDFMFEIVDLANFLARRFLSLLCKNTPIVNNAKNRGENPNQYISYSKSKPDITIKHNCQLIKST